MVILQDRYLKRLFHVVTFHPQSTPESIRPPSVTALVSVKAGEGTCLPSKNARDFMFLHDLLRDHGNICPTVKHDSDYNFGTFVPTEFHR